MDERMAARHLDSVNTLSNALDLVTATVREVVGNDVADTLMNQPLTKRVLDGYAISIIGQELNAKLGN